MFKHVNFFGRLFIALAVVTLSVSAQEAQAKLFSISGKVIARTVNLDAQPGLQAPGMKLMLANFRAADLSDSDFSRSDLRRADFSGADLSAANFIGADLRGANFTGAKLEGANFSHADLRGAVGFQADRDTILSNTIEPNGVIRDLHIEKGQTLIIRNYDAVRDTRFQGGITLLGSAKINGGKIVFVIDNQAWNSTIRCAQGVQPQFSEVELYYEPAHTLVPAGEVSIEAFSWTGTTEISAAYSEIAMR